MLENYADQITYVMVDPVSRPDYCTFENPLAISRQHNQEFQTWLQYMRLYAKTSRIPIVGLDYMLQPSYNWKDCPIAPMNLWVEPNGDIYYCYGFDYVVGNVFKQNPLLAFNSRKARQFRKKLLTSNPPLEQCHSCNFARPGWQIHGGYLSKSRKLSVVKRMTAYEALKHVLSVITRKRGYSF